MAAEVLVRLVDAGLRAGGRELLRGASLELPAGTVTALLGPSGVGKSALLRALAREHGELELLGTWDFALEREALRLVSQAEAAALPRGDEALGAALGSPRLLLLDEPPVREEADFGGLEGVLRAQRARGAALLVTHHLELARELSDRATLLCAGRLEPVVPTRAFFESPPTALAARFVRQGNCWPLADSPRLPKHFRWVLPGLLAGMGRPGLLGSAEEDLFAVAMAGVSLVVTLTREVPSPALLRSLGLRGRHLPIQDMGVPALGAMATVCREVAAAMRAGEGVVFHCHAGIGRTGLALASTLVWEGESAERALARVREVQPSYVQSAQQVRFLSDFAAYLGR